MESGKWMMEGGSIVLSLSKGWKGEGGGRKGDKGKWKGGQEAPMVIYFMQTVA